MTKINHPSEIDNSQDYLQSLIGVGVNIAWNAENNANNFLGLEKCTEAICTGL